MVSGLALSWSTAAPKRNPPAHARATSQTTTASRNPNWSAWFQVVPRMPPTTTTALTATPETTTPVAYGDRPSMPSPTSSSHVSPLPTTWGMR